MWQRGDVIVHHEVWHGRVWAARPVTVVEDAPDRLLLWMPFADLVEQGLVDAATADQVRGEGEAVAHRAARGAAPVDEPWPDWRPDPAWPRPVLPDGWARVPDVLGTAGSPP